MILGSDFKKSLNKTLSLIKLDPSMGFMIRSNRTFSVLALRGFFESKTFKYHNEMSKVAIRAKPIIILFLSLRFTRILIFVQK